MADAWVGISAGLLAGAAGATALSAVTYLEQGVLGDASTTAPSGGGPVHAAEKIPGVDSSRARGLGPLGGVAIGLGVGAAAGWFRGQSTTPPFALAGVATGMVAMAIGDGVAVATGAAESDWMSPGSLLRNLVPHLAYGAVTVAALHRMLDPRTSIVHR